VGGIRRILAMRRDPIGFLTRLAREGGDVVNVRLGTFDVWLLSHPEAIRDVLVTRHRSFMKGQGLQEAKRVLGEGLLTSEGEFHRRQRRLMNPAFHHTRVEAYGEAMASFAERTGKRWEDGQTLDIHQEMAKLTLQIVGATVFDTDIATVEARRIRSALTTALGMFDRLTLPFAPLLERLPLEGNRRFVEAKATLEEVIDGFIEQRRRTGDRGDLLSLLLAAPDQEGGTAPMPDRQIRDEAMTVFLAGHETTANALTWTWYLLSQHPGIEAQLHEELDAVLDGRAPEPRDLPRLALTRRVLAESLRLYPPAWILGRRALEPYPMDGRVVPAGSIVILSPYVVHHDPRWFPDPFRFDPDRWSEEAEAARPKFSFFPFGGGPRVCIGESFAWMEAQLVMATLARRWRARLAPGQVVALEPRVTLRPKYGMRMTLEKRATAPAARSRGRRRSTPSGSAG
jgi:cytochrome P450